GRQDLSRDTAVDGRPRDNAAHRLCLSVLLIAKAAGTIRPPETGFDFLVAKQAMRIQEGFPGCLQCLPLFLEASASPFVIGSGFGRYFRRTGALGFVARLFRGVKHAPPSGGETASA